MRVFLPSRMTIASNLAVPRYITRTKITLWTRFLSFRIDFFFFLSLVNNFLSLHYFEINHSRFYFDLCLFTFSNEFAEKRVWIFHGSRDDLFAGSMHLSTGEVSSIIAPSRGKLFIPLFSSITKVFFSTDSFSFLLFCRDFSSDRLLFTHEKKKDLSRCLMERFLAEWVLPLTEWILLNESRISISYLLCLNALLTSSPFSNPFFPYQQATPLFLFFHTRIFVRFYVIIVRGNLECNKFESFELFQRTVNHLYPRRLLIIHARCIGNLWPVAWNWAEAVTALFV